VKILIVEDNYFESRLLQSMLQAHELLLADSGESALEMLHNTPDLILLDITLPGIDGYETCQQIRSHVKGQTVPIIFISGFSELQDRIKAFDAGGNDYLTKPFDIKELHSKINTISSWYTDVVNSRNQNNEISAILRDVQTQSANIQSITRFIQASMFCQDLDTLLKLFSKTATEIGVSCVLRIQSKTAGVVTFSTVGLATELEMGILENATNVERIHTFGNGRAIFNWNTVQLLTRKVGNLIDVLAIFMDSLEVAVKSIDTEARLRQQFDKIKQVSQKASDKIAHDFQTMTTQLFTTILAMGIVEELEDAEEEKLNSLIQIFKNEIDMQLSIINDNNGTISELLGELKTPPADLSYLVEVSEESNDPDDIVLF
jgi:CheY-like chemotaxis protein